jgi:hypothetical protein
MADKVLRGTKDRKTFQVIKGSSDTREIRCTDQKCKNVAKQVPDGKGGTKYQCLSCGTVFTHTRI